MEKHTSTILSKFWRDFYEIFPEKQNMHMDSFIQVQSIGFQMGAHEWQQCPQERMSLVMEYFLAVIKNSWKLLNTKIQINQTKMPLSVHKRKTMLMMLVNSVHINKSTCDINRLHVLLLSWKAENVITCHDVHTIPGVCSKKIHLFFLSHISIKKCIIINHTLGRIKRDDVLGGICFET